METRGFDCGYVQFVFLAASLLLVGRLEGMPIGGRGEGPELNEWEERGVEDLSPSEMIYLANQELIWGHKDRWFEMDMVLDSRVRSVVEEALGSESDLGDGTLEEEETEEGGKERRGTTAYAQMLWPDALVPYAFDGFIRREVRDAVRTAMEHWENTTCIRFIPREDHHRDYVLFVQMYGCWSYVGRYGGAQMLSLGSDQSFCTDPGVITHELGHAIGFWHEQSRPDRDKYVMIVWENILPGANLYFLKYRRSEINSHEVEYDYESIMHYPPNAFSKNGNWTIVPLQPGMAGEMGQRRQLSPLDIQQANILYSCPVTESPDGVAGDGDVTNRIPSDAFLIRLWNTSSCLSVQATDWKEEGGGPCANLNKTAVSQCNSSDVDQYWKWASEDTDQLLHLGTLLCLSSAGDEPLTLVPCDDQDPREQWSCAGSYIEQRTTGQCVTAVGGRSLEETLDILVDNNVTSLCTAAFATLRECTTMSANQLWEAVNVSANSQSLCAHAPSHVLPRCYIEELGTQSGSNATWINCASKGYYTEALYHLVDGDDDTVAMECCATSDVFTGQPEGPAVAHGEECEEERWRSYAAATAYEGGFLCPEGLFLKGVLFSTEDGVRGVRCCTSSARPRGYDHCFMDVDVRSKEHSIPGCSLPAYRITAVQRTNCDSSDCIEEIMCCV